MQDYPCLHCAAAVRPRQQALQCDGCSNWQHRTCNTGVSQDRYRLAVKGLQEIQWSCSNCQMDQLPLSPPLLNSTMKSPEPSTSSPGGLGDASYSPAAVSMSSPGGLGDASYSPAAVSTSSPGGLGDALSPNIDNVPDRRRRSFEAPNVLQESDLERTIPDPSHDTTQHEEARPFTVVDGGSKAGADVLLAREGFVYGKDGKPNKKGEQRWRCNIRRGKGRIQCKASVKQLTADEFLPNHKHQHECDPKDCAEAIVRIRSHVRREGKARPFASASTLVNEAMDQHLRPDAPCSDLPQVKTMIRSTNKIRQDKRPSQPKDLNFEWVDGSVPSDFIQSDFTVGQGPRKARHILLTLPFLLTFLTNIKLLCVDATFKAVQAPFRQLWGIHGFLVQGQCIKQVPLAFVLMSRKAKEDYKAALRELLDLLPTMKVRKVMMDFEPAVWQAFRDVLPDVKLQGCAFHWTQAMWRNIQDKGLATQYMAKKTTQAFLKSVLCLCLLPAAEITALFQDLMNTVDPSSSNLNTQKIYSFMEYVQQQWVDSTMFPPELWSVFRQPIRTNNDSEGWHNLLNETIRTNGDKLVNIYQLLEVLHKECKRVSTQAQLVSAKKLTRSRRKEQDSKEAAICKIWDQYESHDLTPRQALVEFSKHHHPKQ